MKSYYLFLGREETERKEKEPFDTGQALFIR